MIARWICPLSVALLLGLGSQTGWCGEPLHQRIDQLIEAAAGGPLGQLSDDATFLRRVTLDLAGRAPTDAEAKAFAEDKSPQKRQTAIDKLLAGEDYPRRMAELFHVMLMERRGDDEHWQRFLRDAFAENRPFQQTVADILDPNPDDASRRGAAFFLTKRLEKYGQNPTDYPGLVRDIGRLFLGMDLQCAQCHDHLFIDDYKQLDFQGLFAFVKHTTIRRDTKFPAIGENLVSAKLDFQSVFIQEPRATGPRLPGSSEIAIPTFAKGEEYEAPPDRKTQFPGQPKFRPLRLLAEQLPTPENRAFARNTANRLWFVMFGRGLVHPLDLHHSDNPPSHPELLDLLADELIAHDFDLRWMLRELALSTSYQRAGRLEGEDKVPAPQSFRVALEKPLSSEQLLASLLQVAGEDELLAALRRKAADDSQEEAQAEGEDKKDAEKDAAKDAEEKAAEKKAAEQLQALRDKFNAAFANVPREPEVEFQPSVKAALFLMHDEQILSWFAKDNPNVLKLADQDDSQAVRDVYWRVLARPPSEEELAAGTALLADKSVPRGALVGSLMWALVASTEFCLNH